MLSNDEPYRLATQRWLEDVVIGLNLCPFAQREWRHQHIRFTVSDAHQTDALLTCLQAEIDHLEQSEQTHTTLIIHPFVLLDFLDYNDFLEHADAHLSQQGYDGIYQLASFHPHYQFAGTQPDDAENYTNRSPYPMLHLLREQQVAQVLAHYPKPETIPERNITLMEQLGRDTMQQKLQHCLQNPDHDNKVRS